MRYALIEGGLVANVVEQDSLPVIDGLWVACGNAGPGWFYADGVFAPPPAPPEPLPVISKTAMLSRFTDAEFVGILTAAKTDVAIEAWKYRFDTASTIDLSDARTISGMDLLVSKNLLTEERAAAILTDPVQPEERP